MAKEKYHLFFHIEKRCFGQYSYSLQEEEWKYMDGWQIWHRTKIFDCEYEDTYMTMTMNIHLTMTVNILLTIMWMRTKTTGAVERHPEEWVFPLWIRCSSVVSPPRPEPASLSGTLQCWRSFEAQSPSLFWKQKRFTPVFNGIVEVPVSSPRAVHSLLADLDVCTAAKTFILNCVYNKLYPSPRVLSLCLVLLDTLVALYVMLLKVPVLTLFLIHMALSVQLCIHLSIDYNASMP